ISRSRSIRNCSRPCCELTGRDNAIMLMNSAAASRGLCEPVLWAEMVFEETRFKLKRCALAKRTLNDFFGSASILGMHPLEITFKRRLELIRRQSKNSAEFLRSIHRVGSSVPLIASHLGNTL